MMNKIFGALVLLLFTSPAWAVGTMIATYVGLSGAAAAAASFVINYAASTLVSRIFYKKPPPIQDNGVRQQIPPASTNSLPIVYGEASLGGTFVDAVISDNQQVMWYVMAISHISPTGQFTYDKSKFYYGDRLITFDTVEPSKVISLTDGAGNVDTKISGNLYIYLYTSDENGVITNCDLNGNAPGSGLPNTIMSVANGVPSGQEWPSSGRQMNGLAFAIVKLIYSRDDEATQMQGITYKVNHALVGTGHAKPGDVWLDYMLNTVYGAAVDVAYLNLGSVVQINYYSDELITFDDYEGNPSTQPRYRINGVLDTGAPVLENIDKIVTACDSWMAYEAATGKWSIVINRAESTSFAFDDSNIVGDIRVTTVDLTQSLNQIEARFPNKENKDIPDYVFLEVPAGLLYPNEPVNKYSTTFDLVNDSVQAQYLANRILEQGREDLIVTIKTTYEGIQMNAGDVVSVTNSAYGWNAKLFRVVKVNEASLPDGQLGASLELSEYNAQIYDNKDITQFAPSPNTGMTSPGYFAVLTAPTITNQLPNAAVPSFAVDCLLPSVGRVTGVILYYTTVASPTQTDWNLLGLQSLTNGSTFINASTIRFNNVILPTGTYYFAFKVQNESSQSILSPQSTGYAWNPNPTSTTVGADFYAAFSPAVLQVPYASGTPNFTGIQPQLYGVVGGASIDYIAANTDSDPTFINNTWRIGGSSTTGISDIVLNNITVGNPTDGGNYALFPTPTAMPANPATISVPIRYKDSTGAVAQSATAICQLAWSIAGTDGASGLQTASVSLYQWATATPTNPSGTSVYTWATATQSSYTGGGGWSVSIPANPGTPGILLWVASKNILAAASSVSTSVSWDSGYSVVALSQNGADGVSGLQSATAVVYQWAATIPSGPTGTSTYTWSSNSFSPTPAGWSLTGGTSPSPGYTLWAARVSLVDSATVSTSTINWTTAIIAAAGYAGSDGSAGLSSRICFARVANNPTPTSGTITTSGSVTFPSSAQSSSTWGFSATWSGSDPSPSSTNSLYQSDGVYDPSTNTTAWSTPYISSLKVGTLSAITVNTGALSVSDSLTVGTTGNIRGGQTAYNTGTGFFLGYSSSAYRFSIGSSSVNMLWTGSALQVNGAAITGGVVKIGSGSTPSGNAFEITTAGVCHADNIFTTKVASFSSQASSSNLPAVSVAGYKNAESVLAATAAANSGTSAHGLRGINYNRGTSGLVGPANSYDFYADGSGTNYGPFTGTHDSLVPQNTLFTVGDIVVDVQIVARNGVSSTISEVAISTLPNQKGALGIICREPSSLTGIQPAVFIDSFDPETGQPIMNPMYYECCDIYNFMPINSVGEGQVNVCGENGNIAAGDLIVTSSTPGKGMKQADDVVHGYTVARAREAVTFDDPTQVKMIACIYLSG